METDLEREKILNEVDHVKCVMTDAVSLTFNSMTKAVILGALSHREHTEEELLVISHWSEDVMTDVALLTSVLNGRLCCKVNDRKITFERP